MLLDHALAGTGPREGVHLPAQLQPAVLQHQRHLPLLHLHLQAEQVAGHLPLDVLEDSGMLAVSVASIEREKEVRRWCRGGMELA